MDTYQIALVVVWIALWGLGFYVADQKGRSPKEGLALAFLFGPLGVIVLALLPTRSETTPVEKRTEATPVSRSRPLSPLLPIDEPQPSRSIKSR
jgi:RsiW-degrading membrane proteinase PrsW (M82 family)